METINATIGYRTIENGEVKYYGGQTDNGICYKDLNAWESGEGIIYIGEYDLEEINEDCVVDDHSWTKNSWLRWVREVIEYHNYDEINSLSAEDKELLTEWVAYNCLCECEWEDLSTMLESWEWEDCIEEIMQEIHNK